MKDKCFFYHANVIDVYDGDTIRVDIDLGFNMSLRNMKVRLAGIDTAEMKSKDAALKQRATEARDWLRAKCLGKDIFLESLGLDKYGRWLGRLHMPDGSCLNDLLITSGLAVSYDGGTKNQELLKG